MQVVSRVSKRLKTQDLRKLGNINKISKLHRNSAQPYSHRKNFVNTSKKLLKNRKFNFSH